MYRAIPSSFWEGRTDPEDGDAGLRWHHVVRCVDLEKDPIPPVSGSSRGVALIGFCCDEGVRLNKGRPGASEGPQAIRKACMNFACHFDPEKTLLIDCGDIYSDTSRVEDLQNALSDKIALLLEKQYFPLIMGGGHEVSFGGYKGVITDFQKTGRTLGVLNMDAHFDLRDYRYGVSSGTAFLQIADLCKANQKPFHYMCLGIRPHSNTEALFRRANDLGVKYILGEDIQEQSIPNIEHALQTFLNKPDACYLTVDMDVFDICDAPGVSAPATPGTNKNLLLRILRMLLASGKVAAFDVAETNPRYDPDTRTARLAAYLIYLVVNSIR